MARNAVKYGIAVLTGQAHFAHRFHARTPCLQALYSGFFALLNQLEPPTRMHGDFTNLSERKLMDCLNRLGYDIEIKVRPAAEPLGHLTLATA
ncbi:MAG: XRE family transcriptional regulator [Acidithiobacillus sp.]